jgi:hypothetical protein
MCGENSALESSAVIMQSLAQLLLQEAGEVYLKNRKSVFSGGEGSLCNQPFCL